MPSQITQSNSSVVTVLALMRSLASMRAHMALQIRCVDKRSVAVVALERLLDKVNAFVPHHMALLDEASIARLACEGAHC